MVLFLCTLSDDAGLSHPFLAACPHTFLFGGTCTPRDWNLGVQAKI